MSNPPNEIVIGGVVYVVKEAKNGKYVIGSHYPVILKNSNTKVLARCFASEPSRFVIDCPIMESETLFEHNFRWIGEPCNDLWEGAEENND